MAAHGAAPLHFVDYFVDIQQDFDSALYFGEAQQVRSSGAHSKIGGVLDIRGLERENFRDAVDDDAAGNLAGVSLHLNHDDAGALGVFHFWQSKFQPEIDDRDYFPAQVEDAFDMIGHLRDSSDFLHPHDLADVKHLDGVLLSAKLEGQIFFSSGVSFGAVDGSRIRSNTGLHSHLLVYISPKLSSSGNSFRADWTSVMAGAAGAAFGFGLDTVDFSALELRPTAGCVELGGCGRTV